MHFHVHTRSPADGGDARAFGGVIAFVAGLGVSMAVGSAFAALQPADPSWVWSEVELWVIAPAALVAAWLVARRRPA